MSKESCKPLDFLKEQMKDSEIRYVIQNLQEEDHLLIYASYSTIAELLTTRNPGKYNDLELSQKVNLIQALAAWRQSKQIYRFDPEFWKLLTEDSEDSKIPVEIIERIPYKGMWIEPLNGFVYFDEGYGSGSVEMKLLIPKDQNIQMLPLKLMQGKTFEECVNQTIKETVEYSGKMLNLSVLENKHLLEQNLKVYEVIRKAIQAVLYICAQNNDIRENPVQQKVYQNPRQELRINIRK